MWTLIKHEGIKDHRQCINSTVSDSAMLIFTLQLLFSSVFSLFTSLQRQSKPSLFLCSYEGSDQCLHSASGGTVVHTQVAGGAVRPDLMECK